MKTERREFLKTGSIALASLALLSRAGDAWAPCAIFPGKQVAAKGWCAAWVKKA